MGHVPVIAKRYALKPANEIISGFYTLVPVDGDMIAKRYALFVKLDVITENYTSGP